MTLLTIFFIILLVALISWQLGKRFAIKSMMVEQRPLPKASVPPVPSKPQMPTTPPPSYIAKPSLLPVEQKPQQSPAIPKFPLPPKSPVALSPPPPFSKLG